MNKKSFLVFPLLNLKLRSGFTMTGRRSYTQLRQRRRLKHFVNSYPAIHQVAEKAAPTAAQWSEKYNHTVKDLTQKGYAVFGYLPLVPVDMR
ncbi:hypothetical protein G4B88_028945 [Cannabis sativa]|uniref:Uncharacterized protein n=1 Tax=Cannabis sativa TaxID=3483 RepID=A0A7J6HP09_CANSA|nr:hypothetical protein G4B88_028945 [Cannabis sativa]